MTARVDDYRTMAAGLLRAARGAGQHAAEALDWALQIVPDSRPAQRLRVRLHLIDGDVESARSLIARSLLSRDDVSLRLLRAECELRAGDARAADADVRYVLVSRPNHLVALELAAQTALKLGEHGRAIGLLERCLVRKPGDERLALLLCEALIASGEAHDLAQAEELAACMESAAPLLFARLLCDQGRLRDAADYMEARVAAEHPDERCFPSEDAMLAALLDVLDACGELKKIDQLSARITPSDHPEATLRLARTMLARGRFHESARLGAALFRRGRELNRSLPVLTVAASLGGRTRLAQKAIRRMRSIAGPQEFQAARPFLAECWRRGLLGLSIVEQKELAPASDRRPSGMLQSLLRSATSLREKPVRSVGTNHGNDRTMIMWPPVAHRNHQQV